MGSFDVVSLTAGNRRRHCCCCDGSFAVETEVEEVILAHRTLLPLSCFIDESMGVEGEEGLKNVSADALEVQHLLRLLGSKRNAAATSATKILFS